MSTNTFKSIFCKLNTKYINLSEKIYQINQTISNLITKICDLRQKYKLFQDNHLNFKNCNGSSRLNYCSNIKLMFVIENAF